MSDVGKYFKDIFKNEDYARLIYRPREKVRIFNDS
jgi:hypothetical protein